MNTNVLSLCHESAYLLVLQNSFLISKVIGIMNLFIVITKNILTLYIMKTAIRAFVILHSTLSLAPFKNKDVHFNVDMKLYY